MSAPSAMHAEMQAHARMSALINRRTAFIRLNRNFHFQLSTVAPTRGGLSRGKFEAVFGLLHAAAKRAVLLGADSVVSIPFTSSPQSLCVPSPFILSI